MAGLEEQVQDTSVMMVAGRNPLKGPSTSRTVDGRGGSGIGVPPKANTRKD